MCYSPLPFCNSCGVWGPILYLRNNRTFLVHYVYIEGTNNLSTSHSVFTGTVHIRRLFLWCRYTTTGVMPRAAFLFADPGHNIVHAQQQNCRLQVRGIVTQTQLKHYSERGDKYFTSMAVFIVCNLTESGSQTPSSFMSTNTPLHPSTPQVAPSPAACLARSSVTSRTTGAPQLCASTRGITSSAAATDR